jgi:hypothetical protein
MVWQLTMPADAPPELLEADAMREVLKQYDEAEEVRRGGRGGGVMLGCVRVCAFMCVSVCVCVCVSVEVVCVFVHE